MEENKITQKDNDDKSSVTTLSDNQYDITIPDNPNAITIKKQDFNEIKIFNKTEEEFIKILRSFPDLTDQQVRTIEVRYLSILRKYKKRIKYINKIYHFFRLFISLGSVSVPALLTIQTPNGSNSSALFWFTWMISLLVTIFHNLFTFFRLENKYSTINSTIDKLTSEGWQYLELGGRYTSHHHQATHANQYILFVNTIEKIKSKQSENDYNYNSKTESKKPISEINNSNNNVISKIKPQISTVSIKE
jgi:hypothetical protein